MIDTEWKVLAFIDQNLIQSLVSEWRTLETLSHLIDSRWIVRIEVSARDVAVPPVERAYAIWGNPLVGQAANSKDEQVLIG